VEIVVPSTLRLLRFFFFARDEVRGGEGLLLALSVEGVLLLAVVLLVVGLLLEVLIVLVCSGEPASPACFHLI